MVLLLPSTLRDIYWRTDSVAHLIRDMLTGTTIVVLGMLASLVASILLLFLWLFFHVLGALAAAFFVILLFFAALWLVGFLYRKLKETAGK